VTSCRDRYLRDILSRNQMSIELHREDLVWAVYSTTSSALVMCSDVEMWSRIVYDLYSLNDVIFDVPTLNRPRWSS
jgi:hypothetical protein